MDKKISVSTLFLVLAIILIGVMGYMMYNLNIQNNDLEKRVEELANKQEIKENSFAIYQENYEKAFKQTMTSENRIEIYTHNEYSMHGVERIYLDKNNDAYLTFNENSDLYKKYGENYKIETGVANIFLCDMGNGGYQEAIFLKLDGTASYVSGYKIETTNSVNCENIDGVENAVNVINYLATDGMSGGWEYAIIDINGNVIKEM